MSTQFLLLNRTRRCWLCVFFVAFLLAFGPTAFCAVVINEIHYHPVEEAAFDTNGLPLLDLSEDVHEFIELFNPGPGSVALTGWQLSGGVRYNFPDGTAIAEGQYLVIAKDPAQLAAVPAYGLSINQVFGPWSGKLGNSGDSVRLQNANGDVVDSVSYSSSFPWAIGADALGADEEWTGLHNQDFQYRGRSLERVSATWPANDPANWLASPAPGDPSPGRANAVTLAVPRPVVIAFSAYQNSDGEAIIRSNQLVQIDCTFSATNNLSNVSIEYFVDNINATNETHTTVAMSQAASASSFTATLPGQIDRSVVRYRFRADRGNGVETVSPRADDPFSWNAYFVTPFRSTTNRIYECFVSTASMITLTNNITQQPHRTTTPDPPGTPRAAWNATEPAVFVYDGEVFDIRIRYHGSPFRRTPSRNSFKVQFPRFHPFEGRESAFITDKTSEYFIASALYRAAGLPFSYVRWVDWYFNSNALLYRLEEDEMDSIFFERFEKEWLTANPDRQREESGEWYKSQGTMINGDPEGPYGAGTFYRMASRLPYWTELDRDTWTYALQMNGWKGHTSLQQVIDGFWAARGDSPSSPNPNLTATRAFLEANFDVDSVLTYLAIRNWSCGWDDIFQNYFAWHRANGRWAMLPWDVDNEIGGRSSTTSIFIGELGNANNMWPGPNWLKDSFFKAYRNEFKERLFLMNNTLMNPANIGAMGFSRTFADARFASVNSQLALGTFQRPGQPIAISPVNGQAILPPTLLQASEYSHSASPAPAQASTTWVIRDADGSYAAPTFKQTSTSNLTSLAIPFDLLTFGNTYFWKCFYTDANGHPSLESTETSFVFGGQSVTLPLLAIDATTQWRYNQSGTNPPANWNAVNFDDSAWFQGPALLGTSLVTLPEPIRTPLTTGTSRLAYYFRTTFNFSGDPATTRLRLRQIIDDGVVIYLNGIEVLRTGMPDGSVTAITTATRNVGNAVYEGPFTISAASLVQGTNVLAAEVHQVNINSSDIAFGVAIDALVPPTPGGVVLSEMLADNQGSVTNGGTFPDYVELYNSTDITQSLNGISLSDNVLKPGKFIFPADVTIAPHGYLVVWCDDQTNAPGLHAGFALDNDGQTVALFSVTTNGFVLTDSVTFGLQASDFSIGRIDGVWQLNTPTPGGANSAAALGPATSLKINEWMATDASGPDWLELYNPAAQPVALGGLYLSDDFADPGKSVIAPLSFIASVGYRQFIADSHPDNGARHVDFKLAGEGEQIGLYDATLSLIDSVTFGPQSSGVSQGRLPDGSTNIVFFPTSATPEDANYLPLTSVVINELRSHSDPAEDLIELYNSTEAPIDMSGWWMSDKKSELRKFRIPPNSVIYDGDYFVFYEHQFNTNTGVPFTLDGAHGGKLYLSVADAAGNLTGYRTEVKYDPAESGVSQGRFLTSQGVDFVALSSPSFGYANYYAKVGPIVISEIMYHPPDSYDGSDNQRDEFIELRNIASTNVALFDPAHPTNTWRLRDAVDFTFPTNVTLVPGEAIVVLSFDPAKDANSRAAFLDYYGSGASSARLFGPYSGKLDNSSDSVELVKPDVPIPPPSVEAGYVPSILVDRVHYSDSTPWPALADGSGASLQRLSLTGYGNDPTNWFAASPTPGAANTSNALPSVTLSVPAPALVGPTNVLLSATAQDPDGSIAKVEFFANGSKLGEVTASPFNFTWMNAQLGDYRLTARARDNRNGASVSMPIALHIVAQLTAVSLTAPIEGSLWQAGAVVTLNANASNSVSAITNVEFLVDGAKVASDGSSPYSATWTAIAGNHTLAAAAVDNSGLRATSAPVNIAVQAVLNTNILLVASNSYWRYLDNGTDQGTNWINLNFSDNTWSNGLAELGYGDTIAPDNKPEATVIGYGPDPNNRYITYYFRQKFMVDSLDNAGNVTLAVMRDDGCVAYINGVEVFRSNMPNGPINYRTLASSSTAGADEATFFPTNVNPSRLVVGTNIVAVEVHQVTNNSVDLSFSAYLTMTRSALGPAITTEPQSRTETNGANVTFSVTAGGTAPLSYQWRLNDQPLNGATAATLVLDNIQAGDAGSYTVVVSNSVASIASAPATLTVIKELRVSSSVDSTSGRLTLSFPADPARTSTILASTDLKTWTPVATFPAGGGSIQWSEPATNRARFYQIDQQ